MEATTVDTTSVTSLEVPEPGQLVNVRGARWSVTDVSAQSLPRSSADDGRAELQHAVTMQSVEEEHYGRDLTVIWELEPGRSVVREQGLPERIDPTKFDNPTTFAAYVDALRWGALTSADPRTLQAPFRSSATVEDYQLEPLRRALESPRANMLLADDVGLGKTIEAGLVIQELLLRHRARSVIVVCPAGLQLKWQEEMRDKFGLSFEIVNSETMKAFRRTFGVHANPFRVYPRVIVSMSWLPSPRAERMLDEVYASVRDSGTATHRAFDVLVVDEAHHVAPSTPSRGANDQKARYAIDSQRTVAVRRLAEVCEHRLFLSATPHNGYTESFTALLEMIDQQRFARGADLDEQALREVAVRRLKRDLPKKGFKPREVKPLHFEPTATEAEAYERLIAFTKRRNTAVKQERGRRASDLATLILKKRFFSSPVAFASTAEAYLAARGDDALEIPDYDDVLGEEASDEEEGRVEQPELEALRSAKRAQVALTTQDVSDLEWLIDWGNRHEGRPDSKLEALLRLIEGVVKVPGLGWGDQRIVIFTEYVSTLEWLEAVLEANGFGGDRVAVIHGGTQVDDREDIRARFTAPPSSEPVRILLATDAAGEGIDLQTYCHRLVNFDIPFNPNRLEQRIGRIDRYGQLQTPLVWHPQAAGAASDYAKDVDLLARVAQKLSQVRRDIGSANEIIAPDLQRALGFGEGPARKQKVDAGEQVINTVLQEEHTLSRDLTKLAERLDVSRDRMHLHEQNLLRVMSEGLRVSGQPELVEVDDSRGDGVLYEVPRGLSKSWLPALDGLDTRLNRGVYRPLTFDEQRARALPEAVFAHLGHPLVQRAARELRSQVWTRTDRVRGISAVVVDGLDQSFAAGVARLVLVGEGGVRLHEEVFLAGTRLSRRQELGMEKAEDLLNSALDGSRLSAPGAKTLQMLASRWNQDANDPDGVGARVAAAVATRAERRRRDVSDDLAARREADLAAVDAIFARFRLTLDETLARADEQRRAGEEMLFELPDEKQQRERDLERVRKRLVTLEDEQRAERDSIERRYRNVTAHTFVAALVFALTPDDVRKLEA
ncbi:helicase SNF2 family protein [Agromyces luteolus]|uniref:ATP-dependent helicase n=1 Tax=Agromyces luteolus TaxID=88373 RepID=A0A7C9LJ05_9MICO|nr:DISARM system SNF2-like helicase DrmD [Agromyces luteolus]MUN08935.1 ATP-dependent helicase [Agromyces luteolus]GLK28621.1 helicase SNF2 family protein [Agromyces luteolus]